MSTGLATVTVRVPAKINLQLSVGPRRGDGHHPLTTVFLAVGLHDTVTAAPHHRLALTASGPYVRGVPLDGRNLAARAVHALAQHHGRSPRVRLHLTKGIPAGAGLAGGSADAAAALLACDRLWGTASPHPLLHRLAGGLGSDVPFALRGGAALGTGRGHRLAPLPAAPTHWVVAVGEQPLPTEQVYRRWDAMRALGELPVPRGGEGTAGRADPDLLDALRTGDAPALARHLTNDLLPAALSLAPALRRTRDAGLAGGALAALLCGSGSTWAFLAADAAAARSTATRLRAAGHRAHCVTAPCPGAHVLPAGPD
ncbi:4-(cytidine 5'-diphospho)-2-C-methyl-D-erythritol kinase [Kitasatospora sp. NPDC088391]|uniref:4-(cytidine 5'-diphospho)-2-C-methyl-D-erythritol kinase n=1 Tax=Kitasatospora sp. NPDC088391 TaxID=3364074 RepID=UPI003804EB3F